MIVNTVMWIISSMIFFAWIFGITLKRSFAANAKHFCLLLVVHVALSITAIELKKRGVVVLHKSDSLWLREGLAVLLKSYMVLVMVIMVSFMVALVSRGAQQMTHFHKTYNAGNLNRNPVKFYLNRQSAIVWGYRFFFLLGGVYMLWAIWFRLPF
ncbi:hypothetical protein [Kosakonia sp.]|uniref:hypothetical protein n=1 Tax=Kosakonia sp. TaxID=1916651 RepID=UPI002896EE4E|nr:hypothetical protein [Kosakonia sp.]